MKRVEKYAERAAPPLPCGGGDSFGLPAANALLASGSQAGSGTHVGCCPLLLHQAKRLKFDAVPEWSLQTRRCSRGNKEAIQRYLSCYFHGAAETFPAGEQLFVFWYKPTDS
ncbi:uncharacterized protein LOC126470415 [Schistocerca serialis cubense]|uniref:uncharacterized protein LOC126470415 n=1 Tax=Schistocerca serialis cubense TaxID=2023355 RepID=UPI00214EB7C1|nr:uncharacterized protein LOC126470415 [Schistocerca serialis cubense]